MTSRATRSNGRSRRRQQRAIGGPALTPWLLARIAELTDGALDPRQHGPHRQRCACRRRARRPTRRSLIWAVRGASAARVPHLAAPRGAGYTRPSLSQAQSMRGPRPDADLRGQRAPGFRGGLPVDRRLPRPARDARRPAARGAGRVHRPGARVVRGEQRLVVGNDRDAWSRRRSPSSTTTSPGSWRRRAPGGGPASRPVRPAITRRRSGSSAGTWTTRSRATSSSSSRRAHSSLRLLMSGQAGSRHELAEFTREDIADMVARGPEPAPH